MTNTTATETKCYGCGRAYPAEIVVALDRIARDGETARADDVAETNAWAAREHGNCFGDMSPTLQAVVKTGAARDEAMREAYEAEGTPAEAAADQRYAAAELAHMDACRAHRAARRAHGDNV